MEEKNLPIRTGRKISHLIGEIRSLIIAARTAVSRNIDTIQVLTNFEIGRRIVEHEQQGSVRAEYGKQVINEVSRHLTDEFGKGFSSTNLKLMRQFYVMYKSRIGQTPSNQSVISKKSQTVSDQLPAQPAGQIRVAAVKSNLSWSHYVFLIGLTNADERRFYEIESAENGWSLAELRRQFDSGLYERLALSRNKKGIRCLAKKGHIITKAKDIFKEPYVLEFLGLDEKARYSESDLESAIIDKIEHFLLEMGKGFLFEARQKRFTFDDEHFFVDLVFYNRLLRCYVLIDLKIGKLIHQNLGQMQMYVNYFDRYVKHRDENPTIGIILCRKKTDALVEITLPKKTNIRASQYQLYLPSKQILRQKLLDWTKDQEVKDNPKTQM